MNPIAAVPEMEVPVRSGARRHRPLYRQRSNSFRFSPPSKPATEDKLGISLSVLDLEEEEAAAPLPPIRLVDYSTRRRGSSSAPTSSNTGSYTRDELKLVNSRSITDEDVVRNLSSHRRRRSSTSNEKEHSKQDTSSSTNSTASSVTTEESLSTVSPSTHRPLFRQRSNSFRLPSAPKPRGPDKLGASLRWLDDTDGGDGPSPVVRFRVRRRSANPLLLAPPLAGDQTCRGGSPGDERRASAQRRRASMAGSLVPPPTYWVNAPLPPTSISTDAKTVQNRRPKWSRSSSCSQLDTTSSHKDLATEEAVAIKPREKQNRRGRRSRKAEWRNIHSMVAGRDDEWGLGNGKQASISFITGSRIKRHSS